MPNNNDPPRNRPWERGGGGGDEDDDRPRRRRDRDDDEGDDDDRPRRRRYDDEDRPRRRGRSGAEEANGLALTGVILGALAFCTAGLTAIPGLICSALALGKPTGRGMAIAGVALSVVGAVVGVGGTYFAYTKMRSAGRQQTDANNMKEIGLALHNHHDTRAVLSPYALDASGKAQTGLSFRVGLLPYIEQEGLYRRFDLTQPWDSLDNRSLAKTPLKTYTSPFDGGVASANTPYRVFVGGGAMFNADERAKTRLID